MQGKRRMTGRKEKTRLMPNDELCFCWYHLKEYGSNGKYTLHHDKYMTLIIRSFFVVILATRAFHCFLCVYESVLSVFLFVFFPSQSLFDMKETTLRQTIVSFAFSQWRIVGRLTYCGSELRDKSLLLWVSPRTSDCNNSKKR